MESIHYWNVPVEQTVIESSSFTSNDMLKHKKSIKQKCLARVWVNFSYSLVQRSKRTLDKAEQSIECFYPTIVGLY